MPRRESYRTDDEDDDLRRAAASGGGVPGWVWVVGGGGVLAVLLVVGLGFAVFSSRREAAARHEVARAEAMHAHDMAVPAPMRMAEAHVPDGGTRQLLSLTRITNAFKNDRAAADARYTGQQLRVRVEVKAAGAGWVGASADLGGGVPRETAPNVIFRFDDEPPVVGESVVVEGQCDGLSPDQTLTFSGCRVMRE
jgi:hypothetical protein